MGIGFMGLDNLSDYYDVGLKRARLDLLNLNPDFKFTQMDLVESAGLMDLFATVKPDIIFHLAAQAGVRYSLENPEAYHDSNLTGFLNILEAVRHYPPKHFIFASSSSVYGPATKTPSAEEDDTDHPLSFYAATKKANEVMAHSYHHLFGVPMTGVRFFTVYGPWGRPDMAYFSFTKALFEGKPITVYDDGTLKRDFTFIDDVLEGLVHMMPPDKRFRIFNLGHGGGASVQEMIGILEEKIGRKAMIEYQPKQASDVIKTCADMRAVKDQLDFTPSITLADGLTRFVEWYKEYHKFRSGLMT
jgi:UDP-glucuronate 4-epimerase